MASIMSLGVLSMRLRLALLRHKVNTDAERLLRDAEYASTVADLCRQLGGDCATLAEQFMSDRAALQAPLPADPGPLPQAGEAPAQKASTRFAASQPPVGGRPTGATAPGPLTTQTSSGGSTVTGATGSAAPHDRDDPDSPRNRRYLRGAR